LQKSSRQAYNAVISIFMAKLLVYIVQ